MRENWFKARGTDGRITFDAVALDQHIALLWFAEMVVSVGDDPMIITPRRWMRLQRPRDLRSRTLQPRTMAASVAPTAFAATIIQSPRIEP